MSDSVLSKSVDEHIDRTNMAQNANVYYSASQIEVLWKETLERRQRHSTKPLGSSSKTISNAPPLVERTQRTATQSKRPNLSMTTQAPPAQKKAKQATTYNHYADATTLAVKSISSFAVHDPMSSGRRVHRCRFLGRRLRYRMGRHWVCWIRSEMKVNVSKAFHKRKQQRAFCSQHHTPANESQCLIPCSCI